MEDIDRMEREEFGIYTLTFTKAALKEQAAGRMTPDLEAQLAKINARMECEPRPIELVHIPLQVEDLLFRKEWIDELGGVARAKEHLLDIINRYFHDEYLDPELAED